MRTFTFKCKCGNEYEKYTILGNNKEWRVRGKCKKCSCEYYYKLPVVDSNDPIPVFGEIK